MQGEVDMFFFKPDKSERRRWTVGFALVLMMHAGFAVAVSSLQVPQSDGGGQLDAVMIDMVAVAPPAPEKALPVGIKQVEHKPLPKPKPEPHAVPDPEVSPEPEPEEEEEKEAVDQTTAPQFQDVAEAEVEKSPSPLSGATQAAVATWQGRMVSHLQKHKRYPRSARIKREEGTAQVRFTLDRDGRVLSSEIVASSGISSLDSASLALLARAQPLPKPPADYLGETFELIVPIDYFIR
jgi:protein TonB